MNKIRLIQNEPGYQKLNFHVNETNIYMKRDDLIDFAFGGNKVRLFEYIAADIIKKKAEKMITFGSIHSNHVRVAAIIANYLGISCDLIILYDNDDINYKIKSTPNLQLIKECKNVRIVYCKTSEATEFIDKYLNEQDKAGLRYYWIPGGGHMTHAVNAYKDVAYEIKQHFEDICSLDAIFLPCGTGTTMAGVISGIKNEIPVYGITVARTVERCRSTIYKLINETENDTITMEMINVLPCEIPYGIISEEINDTISALLKSDGIHIDPIYNAKAFFEMKKFLSHNPEFKNVLYINTGGLPNLFSI